MFQRFTAGVLGVVLSAALASAQATLTVPQTINVGEDISIAYEDRSRAGQTITVTVSVSSPGFTELQLLIHLDQVGKGSMTWTVPDGISVAFNAPGVHEIVRFL